MFENPRRGKQARNFTKNVPKILDLKSPSEQIFSEKWRWVPLIKKTWVDVDWQKVRLHSSFNPITTAFCRKTPFEACWAIFQSQSGLKRNQTFPSCRASFYSWCHKLHRAYAEGKISKSLLTAPRPIPFSFCPSYFFCFIFPDSFLVPLLRIYWASFWFENFLQNTERERVVETSKWVVEHEQDFSLEFFWPN